MAEWRKMYKLTKTGKKNIEDYIAELKAKRKEILDARLDTIDETPDLPTVDEVFDDLMDQGIDDSGEAYNGWFVTDHYDADILLLLKLGRDFIEVPDTEAVEVCPHCEAENSYPGYDASVQGYIAKCKTCGEEIFLCDECKHAEDNPTGKCDWCKTATGGKCFRGETHNQPDDNNAEKIAFEQKCYEAYQLDWMISHGYSLRDVVNELAEIDAEMQYDDDRSLEGDSLDQMETLFNEFEYERGFGGSIYVCKDEFLGAEFLDRDYMDHLLGLMPNKEANLAFWEDNYMGGANYFTPSEFEQKNKVVIEGTQEVFDAIRARFNGVTNNLLFTEKDGRLIITVNYSSNALRAKQIIEGFLEAQGMTAKVTRTLKAKPETAVDLSEMAELDQEEAFVYTRALTAANVGYMIAKDLYESDNAIIINVDDINKANQTIRQVKVDLSKREGLNTPYHGWKSYMREVIDELDSRNISYIEGYAKVYVAFRDVQTAQDIIEKIKERVA